MTPNAEREAPPTWEQSATYAEVREFALTTFARALNLYTDSVTDYDGHGMQNAVAIMRNVSTRLDQFRRMKERQWAKSAPRGHANAKGEM